MGNTAHGLGRLTKGRSKWMEYDDRVDDYTLKRVGDNSEKERRTKSPTIDDISILRETKQTAQKQTAKKPARKIGRPSGKTYQPSSGGDGGDWQGDVAEGQNTRENRQEKNKKKRN